jgi:hypothetical protein
MNKTLWKLQIVGERMWALANMTAQQSCGLGHDGRGFAVVADETRILANKIHEMVEQALFGEREIEPGHVKDIAVMLSFLALNCAIESSRMGWRGKAMAVCADDIRSQAYEIGRLFDSKCIPDGPETNPMPKDRMTSVSQNGEFMLMNIAGVYVVEPLINVKEVIWYEDRSETHINLRGMEIPLVDGFKLLGKTQDMPTCVVLHTPWAEQNKTYAVTADVSFLSCLFYSPIGTPVPASPDAPLAKYIRECWESENDAPFYFMDWPKMV